MPTRDDRIIQAALGFEGSFSLVQLKDETGESYTSVGAVLSRLVTTGELRQYKAPNGTWRYIWI